MWLRVIPANPLRPRRMPTLIRIQQDLTLLRDRPRNPLKSQREPVEVNGPVGEADIVLAVVASGALLGLGSVGPK